MTDNTSPFHIHSTVDFLFWFLLVHPSFSCFLLFQEVAANKNTVSWNEMPIWGRVGPICICKASDQSMPLSSKRTPLLGAPLIYLRIWLQRLNDSITWNLCRDWLTTLTTQDSFVTQQVFGIAQEQTRKLVKYPVKPY